MHAFLLIIFCISIGIISRLLFLLTNFIGKRTTALNRFFLDFAWAAAAPSLLFLLILFFNGGVFVLYMPLFVVLGFLTVQILLGIKKKAKKTDI